MKHCQGFAVGFVICSMGVSAAMVGAEQVPSTTAPPAPVLYDRIQMLTGAKGTLNEKEGVCKVSVPRSDLHVKEN